VPMPNTTPVECTPVECVPVVLFVDDSIAEHTDPRLAAAGVYRVLFGRA
jgi:hypothetical protein